MFLGYYWEDGNIYHPNQDLIQLGLLSAIPWLVAFELMHISGWWSHPSAFYFCHHCSSKRARESWLLFSALTLSLQSGQELWDKTCPNLSVSQIDSAGKTLCVKLWNALSVCWLLGYVFSWKEGALCSQHVGTRHSIWYYCVGLEMSLSILLGWILLFWGRITEPGRV